MLVQGGRESGSTFRSRHSRIHRPANTFTHSHSLQQLRARKGGARGGKAGFATLSAFPLVPAHAKMVPLKGKNAYASSILPGKEKAYASSILPGKEKAYASSIPSRKKMPAASRRPRREASGFGFIMKLRNRCHRGIRLRRWLIKFSGNIPIENCHAGFYIRHQPDQCQIKRKHRKNNPRYKT